jgi:hypothetical protein
LSFEEPVGGCTSIAVERFYQTPQRKKEPFLHFAPLVSLDIRVINNSMTTVDVPSASTTACGGGDRDSDSEKIDENLEKDWRRLLFLS